MPSSSDQRGARHRANKELRIDIRKHISQWKRSQIKPPFSIDELVVMALALKGSMTQSEVQTWIMQSFGYYLTLGLAIAASPDLDAIHYCGSNASTKHLSDFRTEVKDAFVKFELPLRKSRGTEGERRSATDQWQINKMEARVFFQHCGPMTDKNARGHFPLFRLPPELRLRIYEMVLLLPKSGVELCIESDKLRGYLQSRDYRAEQERSIEASSYEMKYPLRMRPFAEHLALLQVCKQVFEEAMPVFYSKTHFAFDTPYEMKKVLSALPESRRNHIGHVSFSYQPGSATSGPSAFKILKGIKHLRELEVWMFEAIWEKQEKSIKGDDGQWVSSPSYPDLVRIPGMRALGAIKNLQAVRFHGDCDTIKAHLLPKMQIKREFKAPKIRKDLIGKKTKSNAEGGAAKKRKAKEMS